MAKHHYLPQFYLREFTDPDTPTGQEPYVWVHRPGSGWNKRAPKNVAAESGLYSLTNDEGNETEGLEQLLSRVESVAATVIRDKVMTRTSLTPEERGELSLFIAIMQARVPGQHEHIGEFLSEIGQKTLAALAYGAKEDPRGWEALKRRFEAKTGEKLPDDFGPEDLDPSHYQVTANPKVAVALSFTGIELVTRMVMDKGWRFLVSQTPNYFITSDYPFGIYDPVTEGTFYGPVLAAPKTEVSFPLSKGVVLFAGGEMSGTEWQDAPERFVAQMNARTMMRASFLVSPKPTAVGLKLE
jgi:hypothetical protein